MDRKIFSIILVIVIMVLLSLCYPSEKCVVLGISIPLIIFLLYVKENYDSLDPMLYELKKNLMLLDPRAEKIEMFRDNETYTLDKKEIYMCLRDNQDKYYHPNTLIFAAIHELAHCITPAQNGGPKKDGHDEVFYKNFNDLLRKAIKLGLYDPSKPIKNYCGYDDKK